MTQCPAAEAGAGAGAGAEAEAEAEAGAKAKAKADAAGALEPVFVWTPRVLICCCGASRDTIELAPSAYPP